MYNNEIYKNLFFVHEALKNFSSNIDVHDFRIYSWPQQWPNTACGFGGIAGQAFMTAQTTVITDNNEQEFLVYHNDRFAYKVIKPNKRFFEDMKSFCLNGKSGLGKKYSN